MNQWARTVSIITLSITIKNETLSIKTLNAECQRFSSILLSDIILIVIMTSFVMLIVVMTSFVMLKVMVPTAHPKHT
jgi:hypothetical protein